MKSFRKKAFTLVELLIVVLVLGILAGVAVPKFKRVLETRKTTEAENMLATVRAEQEKRCIAGKNYTRDTDKISVLANASTSKNYTYELGAIGMTAKKGSDYSLKMLSYKEGNICCEGSGCANLNKNYPTCEAPNIVDECEAEAEEVIQSVETPNGCDDTSKDETPKWQTMGNKECLVARKATGCENGEWIYENLGIIHASCRCTTTCAENEHHNTSCECVTDEPEIKECDSPQESLTRNKSTISHGYCQETRTVTCEESTGHWIYSDWTRSCTCDPGYYWSQHLEMCVEITIVGPGGDTYGGGGGGDSQTRCDCYAVGEQECNSKGMMYRKSCYKQVNGQWSVTPYSSTCVRTCETNNYGLGSGGNTYLP